MALKDPRNIMTLTAARIAAVKAQALAVEIQWKLLLFAQNEGFDLDNNPPLKEAYGEAVVSQKKADQSEASMTDLLWSAGWDGGEDDAMADARFDRKVAFWRLAAVWARQYLDFKTPYEDEEECITPFFLEAVHKERQRRAA